MVSAGLAITLRIDSVPLSKFKIASLFKLVKLPFNEGAVERIGISGYKRASPVSVDAEKLQILFALRREES